MLFKEEWVDAVLTGRKRQTLRLRQPRVKVGRTYAVQTSFRSTSRGRIRVTALRRCTLAGMTEADLEAEGWPASAHGGENRRAFEQHFARINHLHPDRMTPADWKALRSRPLWCIAFEPAAEGERPA